MIGKKYQRRRDKALCYVVAVVGTLIYLRYADASRAKSAGDWFVSADQLQRFYREVGDAS